MNLQTAAATRINGGLAGGFGHIQRMVGSSAGGDRLVGPGTAGTWTVAAANAGNRNGIFTFAGVENLLGGAANDTFRFGPGGSVSGSLDGGGGTNVLDYSADGGAAATVNLQTAAASRIKGGTAGGFSHIQRVVGSSSAGDTLVGGNTASTWTISGANAGNINGIFTFAAVKNLVGGAANDAFRFGPAGSIAGTVNGGGGSNTLDYSADGGVAATVNLQTAAASRIKGGTAGGFSHIQRVVGSSSAADTLAGANTANTWAITGANAGNINGIFTFAAVENLLGGSANDIFRFGPGGSVAGSVNGGGGVNKLDYSADGGAAATVNLQAHSATRIHGGAAGGFSGIQAVTGSTAAG